MISKQKGTYDLYGEEARKVLALRNIFENIMNNFNYSFIRTPVFESTEPVGSSARRIFGLLASAIASAILCCSPPDV